MNLLLVRHETVETGMFHDVHRFKVSDTEREQIMENKNEQILINELKKRKLCRLFWSDEIEKTLNGDIVLTYEPVGDMGIYSKYFDFELLYCGANVQFAETTARMHIAITANGQVYDMQKAVAGTDCFHNIFIEVKREKESLFTCKFRLWDTEPEEYCGNQTIICTMLNS